jgi:hypothetical protein
MARKKVNKMEVMREALSALGKEASGKELAEFFAAREIKISPAMISNYKSAVMKSGGVKAAKPAQNGHAQAPVGRVLPAKSPKLATAGNTFSTDDIKDARTFMEMVGSPERAKALVEALA